MAAQSDMPTIPVEIATTHDKPVVVDEKANLSLFLKVWRTDPAWTKDFNRGGFKGTMTNPTFQAMRATSVFGPAGIGWDAVEESHEIIRHEGFEYDVVDRNKDGDITKVTRIKEPPAMIYVSYVKFWYIDPRTGKRGELFQFGGTQMLFQDRRGTVFDDEAPKKALTDGMMKAMAKLGFSADIHMGMYDDDKYTAWLEKEMDNRRKAGPAPRDGDAGKSSGSSSNGTAANGSAPKPSDLPSGTSTAATGQGNATPSQSAPTTPSNAGGGPGASQASTPAASPASEPSPTAGANAGTASSAAPTSTAPAGNGGGGDVGPDDVKRKAQATAYTNAQKAIGEAETLARLNQLRGSVKEERRPLTDQMRTDLLRMAEAREKVLRDRGVTA